MAYAIINNVARLQSLAFGGSQSTQYQISQILGRDEEQRTEPPHSLHQRIVNIGSESHPHYELRIDYSDGSSYSYSGGAYHG